MKTFKKGITRRLAGQSFADLFDETPSRYDCVRGHDPFDLATGDRARPLMDVTIDPHFTHLAKERSKSPLARFQTQRADVLGNLLAKGAETGKIVHEMTGATGVYTLPQPTPNLILQTPQAGWVADLVAPPIPTPGGLSSGIYFEWTPATTHRLYDNRIVKGEEPKEIEMHARRLGYITQPYALANRLYETDLANTAAPLLMRQQAADALDNAMRLAREARVLNVAFSPVVPGAAAALGWNAAANGTPVDDIVTGIRTIFQRTQNVPGLIVIPFDIGLTMFQTTNWRSYFSFFSIGEIGPLFGVARALANLGLQVAFSKVCALTTDEGTASDGTLFQNLIGNQVLLAKVDPQPTERSRTFMFAPSRIRDEVRAGQWDREIKTRSYYWQQYEDTAELLVDAFSGYRITGV